MTEDKETAVLKLRRLKRRDRDALLAIEADSFPASTLQDTLADYFEDDNFGYVAVKDDVVVAYMLYEKQSDHIYLAEIAVSYDARRSGIARFMVRWLIDRLKVHRRNRIVLDVSKDNAAAIACYKSLGFKRAEELSGRHMDTMEWTRPQKARHGKKTAD